jgi:hypothetical protein
MEGAIETPVPAGKGSFSPDEGFGAVEVVWELV